MLLSVQISELVIRVRLSKQDLYFWVSLQKGMSRKYGFSFTDLQKQYLSNHLAL
jgi:hypothetical protein